jgi:hypothetical protein
MSNAALAALESALLAPLNTFLTAARQPDVNTQTLAQNAGSLDLSELLALPGVESDLINLVAGAIQDKLNAAVTPLPSATPATPTA